MKPKNIAAGISKLINSLLILTVFATPLAFNPFTSNLFDLNKNTLLAISTGLILILWMTRNILTKSFRLSINQFTLPLFLFAIISLAASYQGLNPTFAGFITTTSTITFLTLLFLSATTLKPGLNFTNHLLHAIVISGIILGLTAVLETIGFGPSSWISSTINNPNIFLSPAGSAVILITYLIPILLMSLLLAIFKKSPGEKSFYFIAAAVTTAALVIGVFNILPGNNNTPRFLPFSTSWEIAAENVKSPKALLLGVGPQNYVTAFTSHKPISFNQSEFWNVRFNTASNHLLHIFTTTGLLGLSAWVFLLLSLVKTAKKGKDLTDNAKIGLIGLGAIFITTLFVPTNIVLQSLFVFLLIIVSLELKLTGSAGSSELIFKLFAIKKVSSGHYQEEDKTNPDHAQILPWLIGVPFILFSLFIFYGTYRVYAADLKFRQSLATAAQNQGTETYNLQRDAIGLNPYASNYRRSYSQTNLSIANALSQQGNPSDQDRETISTLVRQAIREARNAVLIEPNHPINWENLALVYRQLINVADGASDWAITSYANAIRLDPNNPRLRIDLGGIYFQLEDLDSAIRLFEQAATLKPDYANAHYNLAVALSRNNQTERAIGSYQRVLELVDPTTADYTKALEELNQLRQSQGLEAQQPANQTSELSAPEPLATPNPNQSVELDPSDAPPSDEELNQNSGFGDISEEENSENEPEDSEATESAETQ